MSQATVLILDDDPAFARAAGKLAFEEGCKVQLAHTLREARAFTREHATDLIILDLNLPDGNGLELVDGLDPVQHSQVAVVTADPSVETAVRSIGLPVVDYLVKPFRAEQLQRLLRNAVGRSWPRHELRGEADLLPEPLAGNSSAIRALRDAVMRVAATEVPILIAGESGTGKRALAHALHARSGLPGPLCVLECAAMTAEEQATQLFGRAGQDGGLIERAHAQGGAVLVHGVDALAGHLQARLLAMAEGEGAGRPLPRLLLSVEGDSMARVADGRLRADVHHGLCGITLAVPPLRERGDDVIVLAELFIRRLNARRRQAKCLAPGAERELLAHVWPGNVRELRSAVERAYLMQRSEQVRVPVPGAPSLRRGEEEGGTIAFTVGTPLAELERRAVRATLAHFDNDKPAAARALGISVRTVYNHIARSEAADEEPRAAPSLAEPRAAPSLAEPRAD